MSVFLQHMYLEHEQQPSHCKTQYKCLRPPAWEESSISAAMTKCPNMNYRVNDFKSVRNPPKSRPSKAGYNQMEPTIMRQK